MPPTRTRPPQLLIASHNHGAGAELLQLAERRGYAVRRAHSGAQALERAHAAPPDLVVLDESLTDMDAFAATRALRDDADVGPGTPLLLISAQRPSSPQHHAALRAGVWEFLRHPFNAEEVAAKLDTYVLLKLDGDRARRETSIADAIGRVGPGEFAVIAPGTDRAGAVLLAERLARGVKTLTGATPGLRAGYDAVGNARYTPIEPKNLL